MASPPAHPLHRLADVGAEPAGTENHAQTRYLEPKPFKSEVLRPKTFDLKGFGLIVDFTLLASPGLQSTRPPFIFLHPTLLDFQGPRSPKNGLGQAMLGL